MNATITAICILLTATSLFWGAYLYSLDAIYASFERAIFARVATERGWLGAVLSTAGAFLKIFIIHCIGALAAWAVAIGSAFLPSILQADERIFGREADTAVLSLVCRVIAPIVTLTALIGIFPYVSLAVFAVILLAMLASLIPVFGILGEIVV
jgi:hypothetical protein